MRKKFYLLLMLLSFCQQACGQFDKETDPNIKDAVKNFNNKEYEKALIYTNKLIEKDSSDYVSWTLKGRILASLEKEDEAIKAFDKAIKINPKYYEAYGHRAVACSVAGLCNQQQVIRDFDIAIKNKPNPELIKIKANYLYKSGKFVECINECDNLLKLDIKSYETLVLRGSANKKLGNIDLAFRDYTQAISATPKESFAYAERGVFLAEQKRYEEAIKDFDKALELTSHTHDDPDFLTMKAYDFNNRGFAYFKLGNHQKALEDINHSLKLYPTNSYAYKNRALVYLSKNEKGKGCNDLKKALELGYTKRYGNEVEKLIKEHCE